MIYIASPFFNKQQIEEVDLIEDTLAKCNYQYFSPRKSKSSPYYGTLTVADQNFELVKRLIFKDDIDGLDQSDSIVCNPTNLDSGTLFELGYAIAKNKQIIPSFTRYVPAITMIKDIILLNQKMIAEESLVRCLGKDQLMFISHESLNYQSVKYVIAEPQDSTLPYLGISKVLCGYYYASGYSVRYIDVKRKSNVMLTCGCTVYELDNEKFTELNNLINQDYENDNQDSFCNIIQFISKNAKQVFGRDDD